MLVVEGYVRGSSQIAYALLMAGIGGLQLLPHPRLKLTLNPLF
ncbi:hypothetical protein Cylst_5167 [Cylindrospermum stagnale PCC 7417]|uniref:Uncharacterized protein n=1 Tax=Cylindrospermum stagnale PCC 7417 TaxID=56107 RepID=K9X429_9NOST|nr:hypothetical protein Cylst_5167 [Cylindrospermum stagnale PCC 7417]